MRSSDTTASQRVPLIWDTWLLGQFLLTPRYSLGCWLKFVAHLETDMAYAWLLYSNSSNLIPNKAAGLMGWKKVSLSLWTGKPICTSHLEEQVAPPFGQSDLGIIYAPALHNLMVLLLSSSLLWVLRWAVCQPGNFAKVNVISRIQLQFKYLRIILHNCFNQGWKILDILWFGFTLLTYVF